MRLRPATAADIPAVAAVVAASFQQAMAHIIEPETMAGRTPEHYAERLAQSWPGVTVAELDGAIRGVTLVIDRHIDLLFVDPATQGRGVGLALLRAAERAGAASLECFARNHAARAFYERAGWRLTRRYRRVYLGRRRSFVRYEAP